MCRLYGFRANEPTKVECTLVHAQNALLLQSQSDQRGKSHPDGWGISAYQGERPWCERHALAAYEDAPFQRHCRTDLRENRGGSHSHGYRREDRS